MELDEAKEQLTEIYRHLSRVEVFRGYRPWFVALSGALALLAAFLQSRLIQGHSAFLAYWSLLAMACVLLCGANVSYDYWRENARVRKRILKVVWQFLPCVLAGFFITWVVWSLFPAFIPLLPGIWSVLFGLGIFSSSPFLPPAVHWVGFYYLLAGTVLLTRAGTGVPSPWAMASSFGFGQFFAAAVLWAGEKEDGRG